MISTTLHDARGDRQIAEAHLPGRQDDVTGVREAAAVDRDAVRVRQNHVRAWNEDIEVVLDNRRVRAGDLVDDRARVDADVVQIGAGFRGVERRSKRRRRRARY